MVKRSKEGANEKATPAQPARLGRRFRASALRKEVGCGLGRASLAPSPSKVRAPHPLRREGGRAPPSRLRSASPLAPIAARPPARAPPRSP